MNANRNTTWVFLARGVLFGLLFVLGSIIGGMILRGLHVQAPNLTPPGIGQAMKLRSFVLSSPLVGLGLLPLALGLGATRRIRWFTLALLIFVCMGVNTVIPVAGTVLCVCLATLGSSAATEPAFLEHIRSFFAAHSVAGLGWRLLLAIFAFPFVYLLFGSMVGPPHWRFASSAEQRNPRQPAATSRASVTLVVPKYYRVSVPTPSNMKR
jgi:hypothetical protein